MAALCAVAHDWMYYSALKRATHHHCDTSWQYVLSEMVMATLSYLRMIFPCLAPLANDICFMRLAVLIDTLSLLFYDLLYLNVQGLSALQLLITFVYLAPDVLFFGASVVTVCHRSAPAMNRWMWWNLKIWIGLNQPLSWYGTYAKSMACGKPKGVTWCVSQVVLFALLMWPKFILKARKYLGRLLVARSANLAAASIAGLVGSCEASEVLAEASARFRSIRICDLQAGELKNNTPDKDMRARASLTRLSTCDAFVSHSWHDDSGAKWAALQRWRMTFVEQKGREPCVWFDKCCIDQTSIEHDLRCLPVFLSGCRRLVVFCGPTYLTRLWCVIELFTFVHMGGRLDRVQFIPVLRPGHEDEDLQAIQKSFKTFDVRKCDCFLLDDKERMLNIINSIYGDVDDFNKAVRPIFRRARSRGICKSWASVAAFVTDEEAPQHLDSESCASCSSCESIDSSDESSSSTS